MRNKTQVMKFLASNYGKRGIAELFDMKRVNTKEGRRRLRLQAAAFPGLVPYVLSRETVTTMRDDFVERDHKLVAAFDATERTSPAPTVRDQKQIADHVCPFAALMPHACFSIEASDGNPLFSMSPRDVNNMVDQKVEHYIYTGNDALGDPKYVKPPIDAGGLFVQAVIFINTTDAPDLTMTTIIWHDRQRMLRPGGLEMERAVATTLDESPSSPVFPMRSLGASVLDTIFASKQGHAKTTDRARIRDKRMTAGIQVAPSEVVYVYPSRARVPSVGAAGEPIEWSHSWRVRGHMRKLPKTEMHGTNRMGHPIKGYTWVKECRHGNLALPEKIKEHRVNL